jgi:hypothetical protein
MIVSNPSSHGSATCRESLASGASSAIIAFRLPVAKPRICILIVRNRLLQNVKQLCVGYLFIIFKSLFLFIEVLHSNYWYIANSFAG